MTILDRILADTRDLVARRKQQVPVSTLESHPYFKGSTVPLEAVLRREHLAVIAELKKASPSKGVLRPSFDVQAIARGYQAGGADVLSVLTEPLHFQGALLNLALARQAVDLPLLRKDFIVDVYQLYEARAFGADAVLLIAAALDRQALRDLHQAAEGLGLSCLVEVYDPAELDRIDLDQVKVLGVNNRDLRTFEVDIDHSLRVFEHVPASVVRVSESGLRTAEDLAHLRRGGVDAVLIGETFMRAPDPGEALQALRHELADLLGRTAPSVPLAG